MNQDSTPRLTARKTVLAVALAAMSSSSWAQLEEVIVTAQKRASTVQDIAATVNVVTGDAMDKFNTFTFDEIEEQTAGITLDTPNARNANISMRGISTDPEAGAAAAVDVYWNDVSIRQDIAFGQIYDLERLEILRGPQGTLQGSTSPAGAINMVTKKPDLFESDGAVQASFSDNEGFNTQLAYGAPLVEGKFAMRIAGAYDTNYANDVENITSGLDDPENETQSWRLSAVWQITEDLSAALAYQYLDRETDDNKAVNGTDALGERPTLKPEDKTALGKYDNFGELEYDLVSLQLDWALESHDLTLVYGFTDSEKFAGTENDRANYITNEEAPTHQNSLTEVDAWNVELRLASSDNDFWDYMVGVYYQDQETDTVFTANTTVSAGISFYSEGAIPVNAEQLGLFTFNTFYLSELWQLEVGLRWTDYERFRQADVFFGDLNYIPEPLRPLEDLIRDGFNQNFPINAVSPENQTTEEDAVTGSIKLRYDISDETNLYASYSHGYRPSGISIVPDPDVAFLPNGEDDLLHDEEESDSIELGFKGRYMDGRASLNGAVYYQTFDGYLGFKRGLQVLNDAGDPVDISGGLIFNGDAIVYGAELEGQIMFADTWVAGGALSYAKGEWDGAEGPCNEREPGEVLGSCDIDGEAISGEPEWSMSLNSEYWIPMQSTELYFRGLYKFTGERFNTDAAAGSGGVVDEFDEYHILNLYAGWRSEDFTWDVSVWAKNVLDEDVVVRQTGSDQYDLAATGGSYTQADILSERVIGLTARYNF